MTVPVPLVSLAEVKAHLNFRPDDVSDDVELGPFIDAAVEAAEWHVGPVAVQTLVDTFDGGQRAVLLRHIPFGPRSLVETTRQLTVSTVTERVGTAITTLDPVADFTFNSEIGRLTRVTGGYPQPFRGNAEAVVVTYEAGWDPLPKLIRLGLLDLIRYWWQRSQQASGLQPGGFASAADTDVAVPTEFSDLPWSVQVKWKPFNDPPGVA